MVKMHYNLDMSRKKRQKSHLFRSFMVCFSAILLLAAGTVFEKADAMKESWNTVDGSLFYIDAEGSILRSSWLDTDGGRYYLQDDGSPSRGIMEIDGRTYYFDQNGRIARDWFSYNGARYYIKNGEPLKGWQQIDQKTYWFDEEGRMQRGWLKINNDVFYLNDDGSLASGWIEHDGRDYLIDPDGRLHTKSYWDKGELVALDPWQGYARLNLAKEAFVIAAVRGSDLQAFGNVKISDDELAKINAEITKLKKDGHELGFVVYLPGRGGIAYNSHMPFYSASTIKGTYFTSLYAADAGSYDSFPGNYQNAVYYSDNYSYEVMYEQYGDEAMRKAAASVMVEPSLFHDYYADYTAGELAQLWLYNYAMLNYGGIPSDLVECYEEAEPSAIRDAVKPLKTQTKAGWYDAPDGSVANDAGIVFTDKGPYIIAVMSDQGGDVEVLESLIRVLNGAVLNIK